MTNDEFLKLFGALHTFPQYLKDDPLWEKVQPLFTDEELHMHPDIEKLITEDFHERFGN